MEGILGRIVTVILGLLALAGVGYMAAKGFSADKGSKVSTDITQVITNARSQFSQNSNGYTNFSTANQAAMITAGIFPNSMVRAGAVLDGWGNPVTLGSSNNATIGTITFGGGGSETAEQCSKVVTSFKDYVTLVVGGATFTPTNQPDGSSAGAACGNSLSMTISFQ